MNGQLYVISAPSGTGKTTVIQSLRALRPQLRFSVTCTTRAPRAGEQDGREYHFLTRSAFEDMIAKDGFVEWVEIYDNYYGTPRAPILAWQESGDEVLLDIEIQGAAAIKSWKPEAMLIFLKPPSLDVLEQRLRRRGTEDEATIQKRLERARIEMAAKTQYDHIVTNSVVDDAAAQIAAIMQENTKV